MHIDKIQKCHQSWQDCCYKLFIDDRQIKKYVSSFGCGQVMNEWFEFDDDNAMEVPKQNEAYNVPQLSMLASYMVSWLLRMVLCNPLIISSKCFTNLKTLYHCIVIVLKSNLPMAWRI
jgi:hypothetical protein